MQTLACNDSMNGTNDEEVTMKESLAR